MNKKKRIMSLLMITVISMMMLTGCRKNIDKMNDEELYDYLAAMDEEELTEATQDMTEDQQVRSALVLMMVDAEYQSNEDDFANEAFNN